MFRQQMFLEQHKKQSACGRRGPVAYKKELEKMFFVTKYVLISKCHLQARAKRL